jgi:acyl carrier protein
MGLETVEIVIWAEEEFGVPMPDEEVGLIFTVGDFADYIANKVNQEHGTNIDSSITLPKILIYLEEQHEIEPEKVTLSSRFVEDLGFG